MSGPEERIFAWWEYDNDHRPLNRWSEDADAAQRDRFGHAEYIRADLHASAIARAEAAEAERDRFEAALARACLVGGTTYLVERAERAEAEFAMERTDADELRVSLRKAEAAFAAAEDALRLSAVSHRVIAGMDLIGASAVAYNAAREAETAITQIAALKGGAE